MSAAMDTKTLCEDVVALFYSVRQYDSIHEVLERVKDLDDYVKFFLHLFPPVNLYTHQRIMPQPDTVGIEFSTGPLPSIPLPYLSVLLEPYVKEYVTIRWYILEPLVHVVAKAAICVQEGNTSQRRAQFLAWAKAEFTEDVYLSAATTELKKQLFGIPLEEFFDASMKHVKHQIRNVVTAEGEYYSRPIELWIIKCALHPRADHNGDLAPLLAKYFRHFPGLANDRDQESNLSQQLHELTIGVTGPFAGMTHVLRQAVASTCDLQFVRELLQQFVQLAMNAVDVWIVSLNANMRDEEYRKTILYRGERVLAWAWCNMLDNPHLLPFPGSVPLTARAALAESNLTGNIQWVMRGLVRGCIAAGAPKEHLHFTVYKHLLYAALHTNVGKDVDPTGIIRAAVNTFPLLRDRQENEVPSYYRPKGTWDQVTEELIASHRRVHDQGLASDVPVEPSGPRIDPRSLSQTVAATSASENCTICQTDFTDLSEKCVKLNACGHLLHLDCLDALINQAYKGADTVKCPSCRANLCASRDYKAVLDVEE
jgi:hypothetical protein